MILVDNVIIGMLFAIFLFFVFTLINVHSFSRDILTSVILSFNFLYLFFFAPFKGVSQIYKDKKKFLTKIKFDSNLDEEQKKQLQKVFESRIRIFMLLYKNKAFDYNELLLNFARWYLEKPFSFKVRIRLANKAKKPYEKAYIKSLQKDLQSALPFCY